MVFDSKNHYEKKFEMEILRRVRLLFQKNYTVLGMHVSKVQKKLYFLKMCIPAPPENLIYLFIQSRPADIFRGTSQQEHTVCIISILYNIILYLIVICMLSTSDALSYI